MGLRDTLKPANWAPLPAPPQISMVVPTEQTLALHDAEPGRATGRRPDFDATGWKQGQAGFGTQIRRGSCGTPRGPATTSGSAARSPCPPGEHPNLQFVAYHDEDVEIYVNGILAAQEGGFTTAYVPLEISKEARAAMKPGEKILMAVHCHQTEGGQGIDVGLADVKE